MSPTITSFHILYAFHSDPNATQKTVPFHFDLFSTHYTTKNINILYEKTRYLLRKGAKKRLLHPLNYHSTNKKTK